MNEELLPIFIPSYHRADNLKTVKKLIKLEYPPELIYVFIDDEGGDEEEYRKSCNDYGCNLVVFSQAEARRQYDYVHRPSSSRRSAGQARNMMHRHADSIGVSQYIVIDDDLRFRPFGLSCNLYSRVTGSQLKRAIMATARMLRAHRIGCFGFSQGGEMIVSLGNEDTGLLRRKVMNFSFYDTTFIRGGERGVQDDDTSQFAVAHNQGLFCQSFRTGIILIQPSSATSAGGLTDLYNECKLLNKALVTVIQYPSAIHAEYQKMNGGRLHHRIKYRYLAPCLLKVDKGNNIAWDTYEEDVPFTNIPKRKWHYED